MIWGVMGCKSGSQRVNTFLPPLNGYWACAPAILSPPKNRRGVSQHPILFLGGDVVFGCEAQKTTGVVK